MISAHDLTVWAGTLDAAAMLPALIRRLVHETCRDIVESDFPAMESTRLGGWDGRSAVGVGNAWAPEGRAGWELGVGSDSKGKADDDFEKRTDELEAHERLSMTFVFVTPRVWRGRNSSEGSAGWLRGRRAEGAWREVRVLDGEALAQWIETAPATRAWLAERLGRPVEGISSIDEAWTRWAEPTEPKLPRSLFDEAMVAGGERLQKWLEVSTEQPFVVAADGRGEALAAIAALLGHERFRAWGDAAAVVTSEAALARLSVNPPRVVVVANREVEQALGVLPSRSHVLVASAKVDGPNPIDLLIQPLTSEHLRTVLESIEVPRDRTDRILRESGRSITVLRRRLTRLDRQPAWVKEREHTVRLIPFALAGTWSIRSDGDRAAVAELAAKGEDDIDRDFSVLASLNTVHIVM